MAPDSQKHRGGFVAILTRLCSSPEPRMPRQRIRPPFGPFGPFGTSRGPVEGRVDLHLRCVRPSLTDWRFRGDACIVDQGDGTVALRLGDYNLTQITALSLDVPSLNQILGRIWLGRRRQP